MFSNFDEIMKALQGLPPGAMGGAMPQVGADGQVPMAPTPVAAPQAAPAVDPATTGSIPPNASQYASFANPNGPSAPGLTGQFPDAPGMGGMLGGVGRALGTNDGTAGPTALGGLLKFKDEDSKQAAMRGLLAGSMGLMAAGGPSDKPHSVGQDIAQGGMAGIAGYEGFKDAKSDRAFKDAQIASSGVKNAQELYKLQQAQKDAATRQALFGGGLGFNGGSNAGATSEPVAASGPGVGGSNDLAGDINARRAMYQKQYNGLMVMGDGDNARSIFTQMNFMDNEAAKQGLAWDGQQYSSVPGWRKGMAENEYATKAAGQAGTESQIRTTDQRDYDASRVDPGYATFLDRQTDAKRQANRLQKEGAYIDPKSNNRYSATFDNATGNVIYKDGLNNVVSDPTVINRLVQDTPGRTKANMSDPVVKDERSAEAALAQAAGRTAQTVGIVDRMQAIGGDLNRNSWIGTGGWNNFAKTVDNWLPFDNFSGSKRQELDNLMSDQIKTEIESMRGLGAMSDNDLRQIENRVLNGNLNPEALKEIGNRLRKIAQYNASKYEAWKGSGQTDEFRNWAYNFDKDNYEQFMGGDQAAAPSQQAPAETAPSTPRISGVEDFQTLAPGTVYIDPQGVTRTKR